MRVIAVVGVFIVLVCITIVLADSRENESRGADSGRRVKSIKDVQ